MNLQYTQTLISFLLAHQSSPFRCYCCLSVVIMFPWQLLGKFWKVGHLLWVQYKQIFVNKCFVASIHGEAFESILCSSHFRSCINFAYAWLFQVLLLSTKIISPQSQWLYVIITSALNSHNLEQALCKDHELTEDTVQLQQERHKAVALNYQLVRNL